MSRVQKWLYGLAIVFVGLAFLSYPNSAPAPKPVLKPAPPPSPPEPIIPEPPTAPQRINFEPRSCEQILVTWWRSNRAKGYYLWRDNVMIANVIGVTSYDDTGLYANKEYRYQVQAYNDYGVSALSVSISGKTYPKYFPCEEEPNK